MPPCQHPQSVRPALHRGALRREIAASHGRCAHVGEDELFEIGREPCRRDDEAFLNELARTRRHAARRHSPDIGVMGSHDTVAADLSVDVDRADQRQIGEMAASGVRVVQQEKFARFGRRIEMTHGSNRVRQGAQVDRNVRSLRDHLTVRAEQCGRCVPAFTNVR